MENILLTAQFPGQKHAYVIGLQQKLIKSIEVDKYSELNNEWNLSYYLNAFSGLYSV